MTVGAQGCTDPGSGNSAQYDYDAAENTWIVCGILSAQATIMAYTPTPTVTMAATPATIATQTGCVENASNVSLYHLCTIEDAHTRADTNNGVWIPLIVIAIVAFGVLRKAGGNS
jgi:hypothetical protein